MITTQPDIELNQAIKEHTWLHFTQMKNIIDDPSPVVIARGEGSKVWDTHGKEYIDGLAGLFCVNVGYGRQEIIDAITEQLKKIAYVSPFAFPNEPAVELAAKLASLSPIGADSRVFFVTGGSEAVESALKISKQYQRLRGFQGRYKTISRRVAYHGTTMGALSVGGLTGIRKLYEPLVPGARHVPIPHRYRCDYCSHEPQCTQQCTTEVANLIEFEHPETIAATIMEPVQNSGGCIVPPLTYYPEIRRLTRENGIVMIMDEVICGFGRTGKMFGTEHWGIQPDMMTLAKGLTSAYYPLGAVIVSKQIADAFIGTESQKLLHGITFGGHPVAAAAALANLAIIERENLVEQAAQKGEYLRAELHRALDRHSAIGDIRGAGLFVGIEMVTDKERRTPMPGGARMGWLSDQLLSRGLICRCDDRLDPVIQLSPPLIITKQEIDQMVGIIEEVIGALEEELHM
ncbi:MAG TPA: aminotransferase class III-fold pyridoxal phosphate-dependent enzyme [Anaerolineae bacterium]|nr:aminotransferase class III-fold pyridoxal phosphate-dependent enzyme [Anaerolineae bacterium]